jgi:5-methylcytosine-specific restriction endonuclease McrA
MQKNPPRRTPATIADHIVSIAKGGAVHDITNMQPTCFECHERKTLEEQGKRFKRRIAADGWPCDD